MWQAVVVEPDGWSLQDKCSSQVTLASIKYTAKLWRKSRNGIFALGVWTNPALA